MSVKLLIVEDQSAIAHQIQAELVTEGFTLDLADNGEDGCFLGANENYDAIVLDLGLPLRDGVSVLKEWRAEDIATPVLVLTARDCWQDSVEAFNAGGDDYLPKPFHMEELVARLRALIRRSAGIAGPDLCHGNVRLLTRTGKAYLNDQAIILTANELKLLNALMLRPEQIHGKTELAERMYGYHEERDSNTVEVFVARLRRKLGKDFIRTVRGRGYTIGQL